MPRVAIWVVMTSISVLTPFAASAPAADPVPSASILPEDTFVHVSVPDVDVFCERFTSSSGAGLYTGEETAAIREKIAAGLAQVNAMAQAQIGLTAEQILSNASGEFALAVTRSEESPLSFVLIIGFEDKEIVDTLTQLIESAYESQGGEITKTTVEGVEIATAAIPEGDVDPEFFSMNYFVADNRWVIGTNVAILEAIIENWDGGSSRSLATNEIYEDMLDKVDLGQDREPAIIGFYDPITLLVEIAGTVAQVDPSAAMGAGMVQAFLPQTGLQGLLGIMSSTDFATKEGYDAITKQFVYVEKPTRGVLEVFALESGDQTPPAWVSADAGSFSSFSWKVDGAYEAVERLVDNALGQPGKTAKFLDELRDLPDGPGIHIKEDILDQLSGKIRTISEPGTEGSLEDLGGRQLLAFGLNRTHSMDDVLARVAEASNGQLETRDFRGTTVYEFEMPAQSPTGDFGTKVAGLTIAEDSLIFATDVELVESVIRGEAGDALVDSALYKEATSDLPSSLAGLQFTNVSATLKPIYSFLQSGALAELMPDDPNTAIFKELLSDLPEFGSIEKYFGVVVGHSTLDDDGLLTTQRYMSAE